MIYSGFVFWLCAVCFAASTSRPYSAMNAKNSRAIGAISRPRRKAFCSTAMNAISMNMASAANKCGLRLKIKLMVFKMLTGGSCVRCAR